MIAVFLLLLCELITRTPDAISLPMAPISIKAQEQPALVRRAEVLIPKTRRVYNTFGSGPTWDIGRHPKTRNNLIRHLSGEIGARGHAGKFQRAALEKMTYDQLDRLHTNDHEGKPRIVETWFQSRPARKVCPT